VYVANNSVSQLGRNYLIILLILNSFSHSEVIIYVLAVNVWIAVPSTVMMLQRCWRVAHTVANSVHLGEVITWWPPRIWWIRNCRVDLT